MFIGQHVAGTIQPKRDWYICSDYTLVYICSEFTPSYAHITKEVAMIITRWINCGVCLFLMYGKNKHRHIVLKLLFSIMFIQALKNLRSLPIA